MWERHYVTSATEHGGSSELEWQESTTEGGRLRLRAARTARGHVASRSFSSKGEEEEGVGGSVELGPLAGDSPHVRANMMDGGNSGAAQTFDELRSEVVKDLRTLLVYATNPLESYFELPRTVSPPPVPDNPVARTAASLRKGTFVLEEELTPSRHDFVLTASYIRNVVVPMLEHTVTLHNDHIAAVVSASQPFSNGDGDGGNDGGGGGSRGQGGQQLTMGDLETLRQFERVRSEGAGYASEAAHSLAVLKAVHLGITEAEWRGADDGTAEGGLQSVETTTQEGGKGKQKNSNKKRFSVTRLFLGAGSGEGAGAFSGGVGGGGGGGGGGGNKEKEQAGVALSAAFKPSTQKKAPHLAMLSTNCHVHATRFYLYLSDEEDESSALQQVAVSTTFGAPAAHALGFKHGGLRQLTARYLAQQQQRQQAQRQKQQQQQQQQQQMVTGSGDNGCAKTIDGNASRDPLLKSVAPQRRFTTFLSSPATASAADAHSSNSSSSSSFNTGGGKGVGPPSSSSTWEEEDPLKAMALTHLELQVRLRQSTVLSQALGAVVTASLEHLSSLVAQERSAEVAQVCSCGLLLHSACLLSTGSVEEAMLDDFAGCYDLLKCTLRLEPPPRTAAATAAAATGEVAATAAAAATGEQRRAQGEGGEGRGHDAVAGNANTTRSASKSNAGSGYGEGVKLSVVETIPGESSGSGGNTNNSAKSSKHHHQHRYGQESFNPGGGTGAADGASEGSSGGGGGGGGSAPPLSTHSAPPSSMPSSIGNVVVVVRVEPMRAFEFIQSALGVGSGGGGGGGEAADVEERLVRPEIQIIPVLFNLGVNEVQTVANATGFTSMQTEVNKKGVRALLAYHKAVLEFSAATTAATATSASSLSSTTPPSAPSETSVSSGGTSADGGAGTDVAPPTPPPPFHTPSFHTFPPLSALSPLTNQALVDAPLLLSELAGMVERGEQARSRFGGKDVEMLLTSCAVARLLNGARTTSCKSAKDRTSVFHTLEVVRLATQIGLLADPASEQALLDELRGVKGVRLRNCRDNTGRAKYAFNQLQLQALPSELRPPACTAAAWGPS